ncbi:MAG: methyltransferase domain-containing protein [Methanomassiliicoccales archaeon]|jgi:ubiquinone/menaquinone biosynthesis C-methylase UbiE
MVDDARKVFGKNAKWYRMSPEHADREVLSGMVRMANPDSHSMALDVATGTGNTALIFAPFVRRVVGIDITSEMLSEAEDLCRQNCIHNLDLCMADVIDLPFPDSTFDLVMSRRAPHHFSDITGALKEMSRVLRPGGIIAIDDRSVPEDDEVDQAMNMLDVLHDRSHVREYSPSDWREMVSSVGLELREMRTYTRNLPLSRLTGTANATDAENIVRQVSLFSDALKAKFGYRTISGEAHINHWFVMLTAIKPIKLSF